MRSFGAYEQAPTKSTAQLELAPSTLGFHYSALRSGLPGAAGTSEWRGRPDSQVVPGPLSTSYSVYDKRPCVRGWDHQ